MADRIFLDRRRRRPARGMRVAPTSKPSAFNAALAVGRHTATHIDHVGQSQHMRYVAAARTTSPATNSSITA